MESATANIHKKLFELYGKLVKIDDKLTNVSENIDECREICDGVKCDAKKSKKDKGNKVDVYCEANP